MPHECTWYSSFLVAKMTAKFERDHLQQTAAFGPLPVPPRPIFGRHLEQRILNDHRNK